MARERNSNSIKAMTDADLLAVCRRQPWERRLEAAGCGLGLAAGVLAAAATLLLLGGAAWFGAVVAFVSAGVLLTILLNRAINMRSKLHQAELRRRYALPELPQSRADAQTFFAGDHPPDAVLLLRGRGLPHGQEQFVQVNLWRNDDGRGTLLAQTISGINFSRDVPFTAAAGRMELSPQECRRLGELLPDVIDATAKDIQSEDIQSEDIQSMVIDGFPCRLVALRREPFQMRSVSCNLMGLPEAAALHPAPLMMEALLSASKQAGTQPVRFD